jgi:uncharacterized cupredoxin-like copper-binding protein
VAAALLVVAAALTATACDVGTAASTPTSVPGTASRPREVNLIASDYAFAPSTLRVFAGETILLHVVNAGLEVHEAVIGDESVQDAWEAAEAAIPAPPPGPTPIVSVPPDVSGVRVVVHSGQRMDVTWTVPGSARAGLIVGCHIPGHWARGMLIPIEIVAPER